MKRQEDVLVNSNTFELDIIQSMNIRLCNKRHFQGNPHEGRPFVFLCEGMTTGNTEIAKKVRLTTTWAYKKVGIDFPNQAVWRMGGLPRYAFRRASKVINANRLGRDGEAPKLPTAAGSLQPDEF